MKIIENLTRLFSTDIEDPGEFARKGSILEQEEISPSEIPQVVDALIVEIKARAGGGAAISYGEIVEIIGGLPDVEESDFGDITLRDMALNAIDDLVRENPEISLQWFEERLADRGHEGGEGPDSSTFPVAPEPAVAF